MNLNLKAETISKVREEQTTEFSRLTQRTRSRDEMKFEFVEI